MFSTPALLRLNQTSGTSPRGFAVVVYEDGTFDYDGRIGVRRIGEEHGRISRAALRELRMIFARPEFAPSEHDLDVYDGTLTTLCWAGDGPPKTIESKLRHVHVLAQDVVAAVGISSWVQRPPSPPPDLDDGWRAR